MNKKLIGSAILITLTSGMSMNASATLASNAMLSFNDGVNGCAAGDPGTYPYCSYNTSVTSGSYFAMDTNDDGSFSDYERVGMRREVGVIINATQPGYSSYLLDSTAGTIDKPFSFLATYGVHQTTSPVSILSDNGTGLVTLDFSGWGVTWNGIPNIPLGGDTADHPNEIGVANLICGTDCSLGDTFSLDYAVHVPLNDPSGFGGVYYGVHLEGVISAVPIPAAAWLFGSGLIGLASVAQRRKTT